MKTYEKLIQKRLRSLFGIKATVVKNTFKVLAIVLALSSCEKAEELTPEALELPSTTEVHLSLNHVVVHLTMGNKAKTVGSIEGHSMHIIKLNEGESVSIRKIYGKEVYATKYFGNKVTQYGSVNILTIKN